MLGTALRQRPRLRLGGAAVGRLLGGTTPQPVTAQHFIPAPAAPWRASASRHFARRSHHSNDPDDPDDPAPPKAAKADKDPWEEVKDEASGQSYWWNKETNETTPLGAVKPSEDPWQPVTDPSSGQTYYWNRQTNQTTAVGAPKPSAHAVAPAPGSDVAQQQASPGMGGMLREALVSGIGHGVGFSMASRLMDGIMGPRQMEVVHRDEGAPGGGAGDAPPPPDSGGGGFDTGADGGDLQSQGWSWGEGSGNQESDDGGGGGWGDFFGGD